MQELKGFDLGDVSARFQRAMAKADFPTREKLVNLLVNSVTLMTDKAIVKGNIPVTKMDVLTTTHTSRSFFYSYERLITVRAEMRSAYPMHR